MQPVEPVVRSSGVARAALCVIGTFTPFQDFWNTEVVSQ